MLCGPDNPEVPDGRGKAEGCPGEGLQLGCATSRRLLGNGYCSRPAELGCRYETICESCSFFAPTIAFRDTLQNQHDDAHSRGETHRQEIYANVLKRLDETAS